TATAAAMAPHLLTRSISVPPREYPPETAEPGTAATLERLDTRRSKVVRLPPEVKRRTSEGPAFAGPSPTTSRPRGRLCVRIGVQDPCELLREVVLRGRRRREVVDARVVDRDQQRISLGEHRRDVRIGAVRDVELRGEQVRRQAVDRRRALHGV